jgi:hypothetical protein
MMRFTPICPFSTCISASSTISGVISMIFVRLKCTNLGDGYSLVLSRMGSELNQYIKKGLLDVSRCLCPQLVVDLQRQDRVCPNKQNYGACDGSTCVDQERLVLTKNAFWITPTPLALNGQACAFSSFSAHLKICASTVPTLVTPSRKLLHLCKTFYMRVNRVLQHWWTTHLGLPTISYGQPESPCLRECHASAILEVLGFVPTTHEPYIYRSKVDDSAVIFL